MDKAQSEVRLVDTHAHLDQIDDLFQSLSESRKAGIRGIVAVGMDLESNRKTLQIAIENPRHVYPALGYHPWEIREPAVEETLSFVKDHITQCVALGEIGLDYKAKVRKDLQWKVFGTLLDMALRENKPLSIHCRFSHQRALEMVKERNLRKAVFHWYSGSLDLLEKILAAGYFISATPALTYSVLHQQAIHHAPIERILLETDCPVEYQGLNSRPQDVQISLREVARIKQLDPRVVAERTTANASEFFGVEF